MNHQPITDDELAAIEADHTLINTPGPATPEDKAAFDGVTTKHIPRLVAEIRRLRPLADEGAALRGFSRVVRTIATHGDMSETTRRELDAAFEELDDDSDD